MYAFFDSFTEPQGMLAGFGSMIYLMCSMVIAFVLGILLIMIRIMLKRYLDKIRNNFFYVFAGIINLNLLIIWVVAIILKLISFDDWWITSFAVSNLIMSSFILYDLSKFKKEIDEKLEKAEIK